MVSGFGRDSFGTFVFGRADIGNDYLIKKVPRIYKELDVGQNFVLKRFLEAIAALLNDIYIPKIVNFTDLIDPRKIRLDLIDFLASNFGIKTDEEEDEDFRRSELINLYQWLIRKGEDKGYLIKAAITNLSLSVKRLDRFGCGLTLDTDLNSFVLAENERFVVLFDSIPADVIPLDHIVEDDLDLWPGKTLMIDSRLNTLCRSNYLQMEVKVDERFSGRKFIKLMNRVVNDIKPIHVRLLWVVLIEDEIDWLIEVLSIEITTTEAGATVYSYYYQSHEFERVDFAISVEGEVNQV